MFIAQIMSFNQIKSTSRDSCKGPLKMSEDSKTGKYYLVLYKTLHHLLNLNFMQELTPAHMVRQNPYTMANNPGTGRATERRNSLKETFILAI